MYSAYRLENFHPNHFGSHLQVGRKREIENSQKIRSSLQSFVGVDGEISAAAVMQEWFESVSANVFVSHSRADKDLALGLAGWLESELGISSFVDSCAWGHADALTLELDNAFCKTPAGTYSYSKSLITASHVHLMLSTALSQMMDRCECFFFLDTANSLKARSVQDMTSMSEDASTRSPWLFHELSMLRMIRRRDCEEHRTTTVEESEHFEKKAFMPFFNFPVRMEEIPSLNEEEFVKWRWSFRNRKEGVHAMDLLYKIKSPEWS